MKTSVHTRAVSALALTIAILFASLGTGSSQQTGIPRGTLTVDKDIVRIGTRSNLGWNIEYPSPITEIVDVDPTGTIRPRKNLKMKVRVLGAAFQSGNTLLPLDAYWSYNGGSWTNFYYGTSLLVNPSSILISKNVKNRDTIDFGARGWGGISWLPFNDTKSPTQYVIVLGKGSKAPSYAPAYSQGSVTSFLRPYIDSSGRINIGDKDLIVLWESSEAKPGSPYFDMQDLVVLVSFE